MAFSDSPYCGAMRRLEAFWRIRASLIAKASGWLHTEHSRGIWSHLGQVFFIWQTHKHRDPYFQKGFLRFPAKRESRVLGPLSLLGGSGGSGGSGRFGKATLCLSPVVSVPYVNVRHATSTH